MGMTSSIKFTNKACSCFIAKTLFANFSKYFGGLSSSNNNSVIPCFAGAMHIC